MKKTFLSIIFSVLTILAIADDGSRLWLKYDLITDQKQKPSYTKFSKFIAGNTQNPTLQKAAEELQSGFAGLLGTKTTISKINTFQTGGIIFEVSNNQALTQTLNDDGFAIFTRNSNIIISSKSAVGVLYGAFELLRNMQTLQPIGQNIFSTTKQHFTGIGGRH